MVCNDYLHNISTLDEYYLQFLSMEKTSVFTIDSENFSNIILQCTLTLQVSQMDSLSLFLCNIT